MILHLLAPAPFGGIESVVLELAVAQRAAGLDARCALLSRPGTATTLETALHTAGVPVFRLEMSARAYWRDCAAVRALLANERPGILHVHGYRVSVLFTPVARALGLATVTTLHGFTGGDVKNRFFEWLQVRAARHVGCAVAVSEPIAARLRAAGVAAARLMVIPNARRPSALRSRADARRRLGVVETGPILGWIGRLSREKGADVLLNALARLSTGVAGAAVAVLVGEGPERARLAALAAALGVSERVRLVGAIDGAAGLMPAFDAFVLSSRTEGLPMVVLEAIQAGIPVVATRVGGVPALLGEDGGFLVPPEQPDALGSALAQLIGDPEQALVRAARAARRVAAHFGVEQWVRRYDEAYGVARGAANGA